MFYHVVCFCLSVVVVQEPRIGAVSHVMALVQAGQCATLHPQVDMLTLQGVCAVLYSNITNHIHDSLQLIQDKCSEMKRNFTLITLKSAM